MKNEMNYKRSAHGANYFSIAKRVRNNNNNVNRKHNNFEAFSICRSAQNVRWFSEEQTCSRTRRIELIKSNVCVCGSGKG